MIKFVFSIGLAFAFAAHAFAQTIDVRTTVTNLVDKEFPELFELYKHFHANPELSFQEEKSAARVAGELSRAGYVVTTKVGGHGLVAVLKNGDGPTVLIRGDMDALPVKEQTGLPYASKARA